MAGGKNERLDLEVVNVYKISDLITKGEFICQATREELYTAVPLLKGLSLDFKDATKLFRSVFDSSSPPERARKLGITN